VHLAVAHRSFPAANDRRKTNRLAGDGATGMPRFAAGRIDNARISLRAALMSLELALG
jgi:hypothetical protein